MPSSDEQERHDDRIRREAADWFARMRAPDAASDVEHFEIWLVSDARHRAAYDRLAQRWDQTAFLGHTKVGSERHLARSEWGRRPGVRHAAAAAVAAIALVGIVALNLDNRAPPGRPQTLATSQSNDGAAIRTIALPDGSRLSLDTGAIVRIRYSPAQRRLRLERGRVRFAVAHDPERRFIVDAGDGSIVAHGTVFDVTVDRAGVRVALLKGEVEVRKSRTRLGANARSVVLQPGQQVTFASAKPISPISRADTQPWPSSMLAFDGVRLADAIAQFNSHNRRKIRLETTHSADLRISGAYRANDPAGFAEAVSSAFDLRTRLADDQTLVITGRD